MKLHACDKCTFRAMAEKNPHSLLARLWKWHTGWCPGYKAYQRSLAQTDGPEKRPKDTPLQ